jgi:hypothetical protein
MFPNTRKASMKMPLLILAVLAGTLAGCTSLQQSADFTSEKVRIGTDNPSKLNVARQGGGTITVDTVGPTFTTRLEQYDTASGQLTSALDSLGGGATSRELILPTTKGVAVMRSGTDFTLKVAKVTQNADGTFTAENVELGSSVSEPTKAFAVNLTEQVKAFIALSADKKAARLAEVEALAKVGDTAAQALLPIIKVLAGVP